MVIQTTTQLTDFTYPIIYIRLIPYNTLDFEELPPIQTTLNLNKNQIELITTKGFIVYISLYYKIRLKVKLISTCAVVQYVRYTYICVSQSSSKRVFNGFLFVRNRSSRCFIMCLKSEHLELVTCQIDSIGMIRSSRTACYYFTHTINKNY